MVFEEALGRVPTPLHGIAAGRFAAKVNLNTIREVKQPRSAEEIVKWSSGYAWLAGGTWLFSTPQIATDTPDRTPFAAVARACRVQQRSRHCRDPHHRRAVQFQATCRMDRGATLS